MSTTVHDERISSSTDDISRSGDQIHPEDAIIEDIAESVTAELLPEATRGLMTTEYLIMQAAKMAATAAREI